MCRHTQVETEAKNLMRVTETLEARTQALQEQLNTQRDEFSQKLFEAQQDVSKVSLRFL